MFSYLGLDSTYDYFGSVFGTDLTDDEIEALFKKFDTSGTGSLDFDEMKVALESTGKEISNEDLKAIITQVDENSDGNIDFDEFKQIFKLAPKTQVLSDAPEPVADKFGWKGFINDIMEDSPEIANSPHAAEARVTAPRHSIIATVPECLSAKQLSVVIFGATGDLARKKLYPGLYQLILMGHFPRSVQILGYGRSAVEMEAFVAKQCVNIKEDPRYPKADFVKQLSFCGGGAYDKPEGFGLLNTQLNEVEGGADANRLFFLSVPPTVFGSVAKYVSEFCRSLKGFTRVIIEKPFGRDSATFAELDSQTSGCFDENELFRIDHYLGKEVVLNLSALRHANQLFEATWNRKYIKSVEITFKEDLGTGGRGGYFDKFGIIRDIMQNHLLQVFVLCAMEPPMSSSAEDTQRAKVELLKAVETLDKNSDTFLGQFSANTYLEEEGYLEDEGVPNDSKCPTFAAVVLKVHNERWEGVPFVMKAGKGLDERMAEVRITYNEQPNNVALYGDVGTREPNELVCRIQPDEALYLKTQGKKPGLTQEPVGTVLDMRYGSQFKDAYLADAYERMFLNAALGESALFVSSPEISEAWRIFTPLLHSIDAAEKAPIVYPFGIRNPTGFEDWSCKYGVPQHRSFFEMLAQNATSEAEFGTFFSKYDDNLDGTLDYDEIFDLATRLYDGRAPEEKQVKKILRMGKCPENKQVDFDDLFKMGQQLRAVFYPSLDVA